MSYLAAFPSRMTGPFEGTALKLHIAILNRPQGMNCSNRALASPFSITKQLFGFTRVFLTFLLTNSLEG